VRIVEAARGHDGISEALSPAGRKRDNGRISRTLIEFSPGAEISVAARMRWRAAPDRPGQTAST